jgi:hypothetical protein
VGRQTDRVVVIFLYNRLFDPLIQGNFWLYIRDLLDAPMDQVRLHLITYEDQRFPLTPEQTTRVDAWQAQGLAWTPLVWHPGTGLGQKLADLWQGLRAVANLRRRGARSIVSLASVAGTFAYLYARLLGMRLFLYQFEPHSEYAVDNGMWPEASLQYRLSHMLERRAAGFATVIASGTRFMEERLRDEWRVAARFVKLPTVVDDRKFAFDPALRAEVRRELGVTEETPVLFYPGKFGGLYYSGETAWMFRWLHDVEPRLHFLIVTPHEDEEVLAMFDRAGVPRDAYTIRHSDYPTIHRYYFAADFAVIAVPPGPSKKFISNIKVGEYLCAGLPYLITRGVSEDYLYAANENVGVVVDDFVKDEVEAAWPLIRGFLDMDADERRRHCRQVGLDYRGFDVLNPRFRSAIQTLVADQR